MKFNITSHEIAYFFVLYILLYLLTKNRKRFWHWLREFFRKKRGSRQLRPKSHCDCPWCAAGASWILRRPKQNVVPWCERKSKVGRPKTVDTRGCACLVNYCDYYEVTDPEIHALVGNGRRHRDSIQHLLCQPETHSTANCERFNTRKSRE